MAFFLWYTDYIILGKIRSLKYGLYHVQEKLSDDIAASIVASIVGKT